MNLKYILLFIGLLITLFMVNRWILELNSTRLLELQQEQKQLKIESILKCQELHAYTDREDWGYKNCREEVESIVTQAKLL